MQSKTASDRKSFRVCIIAEDKSLLLDSSTWAVGITIRNWIRKTRKTDADDQAGRADRQLSDNGEGGITGASRSTAVLIDSNISSESVIATSSAPSVSSAANADMMQLG